LVLEVWRAAIASHGAPEEVLTDNGTQYVTWRGKSMFTKELEKRGIQQVVAAPRRPQTLGKIERFWGTLWRECIESAVFVDLGDAQRRIGWFIDHYNDVSYYPSRLFVGKIEVSLIWICFRGGPGMPLRMADDTGGGWRFQILALKDPRAVGQRMHTSDFSLLHRATQGRGGNTEEVGGVGEIHPTVALTGVRGMAGNLMMAA
jgi:hypothetical protein